jgi:hypothetical protein
MNMETVNKIINLPLDYKRLGNKSFYTLVKESGYFEMYEQITEKMILDALTEHPECINEWMGYSDDKRSDGWYFLQNDEGKYIVGFWDRKEGSTETEYSDIKTACASFIMKEIEDVRELHS